MDFSLRDALVSRLQLTRKWISLFHSFPSNPFLLTAHEYENNFNSIQKVLSIVHKTHRKYFSPEGSHEGNFRLRLINLRKFFFNPDFGMTILSQSSVKQHYDPIYDYLELKTDNRPEQMSPHPLYVFEYFQKSRLYSLFILW